MLKMDECLLLACFSRSFDFVNFSIPMRVAVTFFGCPEYFKQILA